MCTHAGIMSRRSLLYVIPFVLVLVLTLSACGTNASTTTGTAPGSTATAPPATATATQSQSQAKTDGCPNSTVITTPPPSANIVLTNTNSGTTITAKKGDTIEVNLPFGHTWQGPTNLSQNLLTTQGPAGYAFPSGKACVWRFLASSTGTAHLSFEGRPICKQGQACPMYIMAVPFTVDIQ
jgi:hypothetical protein